MITEDELLQLWTLRKSRQAPIFAQMSQVKALYNADLAVPLPELDRNEQAAVANLLKQGIDGTAQRINSTLPDVYFPPLKPGQTTSEKTAETARRAILGMWQANDLQTLLSRRIRHYVGYSSSPVILRPDKTMRTARWEPRDPLTAYPAPTARLDSVTPDNIIFTFNRPVEWLKKTYPNSGIYLNKRDQTITLLEYHDATETVLMAVAQDRDPYDQNTAGLPAAILTRIPNLSGVCCAVMPGRITLDKTAGQFDGLIPMYYKQAKLDALEYIAIEQGIFPKQWLVARQGETPEVKVVADGRKGIIGVVKGGDIHDETLNPGYKTSQAIDRLAGEQRLEGNIPAEMQGVSGSNIRTGRRGDEVLSEGIDFGIQEAQRVFEQSLREENIRAIAITKAYFGAERHTFYVNWRGATGPLDYTPNATFVSDHNVVKYAMAGSDLNGQVVRTGQKLGAGLISKKTARRNDPEIADPDFEDHMVTAEQLENAFLQSLSQQAATGAISPVDLARIVELVTKDKLPPVEAFNKAHEEAQTRQATSGAPGTPEGPAEPGSPEAQPGVAMPGQGAEAGVPIAAPPSALDNLQSILRQAGTQHAAIARSA
jgi:hypothetical protein